MEDREQQYESVADLALLWTAMDLRDPGRVAGQELGRKVAERADDLGLDQLDLAVQVGLAGLDLVGQRVAVAGRPAADHVRDEYLRALDPDLREQLVEQLPRPADERKALQILGCAGRLADEHHVRVGVAGAEDDLGPNVLQRTFVRITHLAIDRNELLATFIRRLRSHGRRVTFGLRPLPAAVGVDPADDPSFLFKALAARDRRSWPRRNRPRRGLHRRRARG